MKIILIIILIFVISLFITLLYAFYLYKKIQKENGNDNLIKGQREVLEKYIYEYNTRLMSDPIRFSDINHMFLDAPRQELVTLSKVPNDSYFRDLNIDLGNIHIEDKTCACLMPFNSMYNAIYRVIRATCENNGYKCKRSDDSSLPENILSYTVQMILSSQVVIAVLDGRNANVFYEIGIAHSVGKMVIMVADKGNMQDIPFNLNNRRLLLYSGIDELKKQLGITLQQVESDETGIESKDENDSEKVIF